MPAPTVSDNLCGLGFAGPAAKYMEDTFVHSVPPYTDLSPYPVTSTDDTTQTLAAWTQEILDIQTGGDIDVIATGSVTSRSLPDRFADVFNVLDYGAVGDGVTNDTVAIQAAEDARSAVGGTLFFPAGTYLHSGIDIDRALGGAWVGDAVCRFIPTANSQVMADLTNATISSTAWRDFRITGIFFDGNAKTSITAIRETTPYHTTIDNCQFSRLQFNGQWTGYSGAGQTGWINIDNIQQHGHGAWAFVSFDDTHYIFNVNISNVTQQGTGVDGWETDYCFLFRRAVSVQMTNINFASLDGGAIAAYLLGDCQGIFMTNVIMGWPTTGVLAEPWTDTVRPAYVYLTNVGMDQPTEAGFDIKGRTWRITNTNSTNGYVRSSTGPALVVRSTSTDIIIDNFLAAYMNDSGIVVENGATGSLSNFTSENNNQEAGANYEVDLGASPYSKFVLSGKNTIGSAGVNATGQRVVNGVTSDTVSVNTSSAATGANTTPTTLMSYTIPASTLKPGQIVKLHIWGTLGATADTKTVRAFFGATSMGGFVSTGNAVAWDIVVTVQITGSNTQEYSRIGNVSGDTPDIGTAQMTETDTNAITVLVQGENGVANANDIVEQGLTVEIVS